MSMLLEESVPLASLTTFRIGGPVRYLATVHNDQEMREAVLSAQRKDLPWRMIGGGSNVLAPDEGYAGVLIRSAGTEITYEVQADSSVLVTADAGVRWDDLVSDVAEKDLWGIENLAGIPGTVGAAPVQNIGAYGADVSDTLSFVEVLDTRTLHVRRMNAAECMFGYRESIFKHDRSIILLRVGFILSKNGSPKISYSDLTRRITDGDRADSPKSITALVRSIRKEKFPDLSKEGTAGSFFKNPFVSETHYAQLCTTYPGLPGFEDSHGMVKVPLAWVLDKVLHLNGYSMDTVRLFERQPLVLVATTGATFSQVDAFARIIEEKVFNATKILIEREVQNLF
jgi:UDP-N-acetylmuramate dehydrogenase